MGAVVRTPTLFVVFSLEELIIDTRYVNSLVLLGKNSKFEYIDPLKLK